GRFALQREEVDLVAIVRDVATQLSADLARANIALALELPAEAKGSWDALRLEQVVVNLLSNAIKYGDGKPIEVSLRTGDEVVELRVRDHGIGIDPVHQARISERFERAVSVDYGGLGLGLYITRQIVSAHGGTIAVESSQGQGSTFVVDIPR